MREEHKDTGPETYGDVERDTLHRPIFGGKDSGPQADREEDTQSETDLYRHAQKYALRGAQKDVFRDPETITGRLTHLKGDQHQQCDRDEPDNRHKDSQGAHNGYSGNTVP